MRFLYPSSKKNERGVTILIVGLTLLALIAMAALAIDVAGLYVARGEAQRAADAAALAGAKMFAISGYTSNPGNWTPTDLCQSGAAGLPAAVNVQAELAAKANNIAGSPSAIQNISCNFDTPHNHTNPRVTVTVVSATAPVFFARIFGTQSGKVVATAAAEAYNASGQNTPIELINVKPWAFPNCNPSGVGPCPAPSGYFINPSDGTLLANDFIGKQFTYSRQISGAISGVRKFYALDFPASPPPICPSTGAPSCADALGPGSNYANNIACASQVTMHCGQPIGPGTDIPLASTGTSGFGSQGPTITATRCLIHADGLGLDQGQDIWPTSFSPGTPRNITGGHNNPNLALRGVNNISRSDSIVTVPLFDGSQLDGCSPGVCAPTKVIGFLQLGLIEAPSTSGDVDAVILNAVGCSPSLVAGYPPSNPISPGSVSPIIVRLIGNP